MTEEKGAAAPNADVQQPAAEQSKKTLQLGAPIPDMHQLMQQAMNPALGAVMEIRPAQGPAFQPRKVATRFERHDPDDPAKITHQYVEDAEPGKVIERAGRKYMIMRDGSQRRIAGEQVKKERHGVKK